METSSFALQSKYLSNKLSYIYSGIQTDINASGKWKFNGGQN